MRTVAVIILIMLEIEPFLGHNCLPVLTGSEGVGPAKRSL